MRLLSVIVAISLSAFLMGPDVHAQLWEPDGLRIPGDWNSWANTHNMGGDFDLMKVTDGLDRWMTTFEYTGLSGSVGFKFASGGSGGEWTNQWACHGFTLDTLNSVGMCGTSNNTASLTQNNYYTVIFKDNGYATTSVCLMETSADPVAINGQTRNISPGANPAPNQAVTIEVTLSGTKSAEERVFLVYTTDSWTTRAAIELENITGTSGAATIPGQAGGTTVNYYFATSTMDLAAVTATEEDFDMRSIAKGGSSSYTTIFESWGEQCSSLNYHGYNYDVTIINSQCWFTENLRTTSYLNGDNIQANLSDDEWASAAFGAYSIYGDDESGCQDFSPIIAACDTLQSLPEFGLLYNSFAVLDERGLCPTGWHIPTHQDWESFIDQYGDQTPLGLALKEETGWYANGNGTNELGFSAKPAGYKHDLNSESRGAGKSAYFWSSTASGSMVYNTNLSFNNGDFWISFAFPTNGLSVRCVKTLLAEGCLDSTACNFTPGASVDDGSCEYLSCVLGCTDPIACNYNPLSLFENGTCEYPEEYYDCDGDCVNDEDGDGVCDEVEVAGCTDETACNFNYGATDDDGSCAVWEVTSCGCDACAGELLNDIDGDGICDENELGGCTDSAACNYVGDECVTDDDGTCLYEDAAGVCGGDCQTDSDGDGVCDTDEVYGCTDPISCCNYNPLATEDDGTCEEEGAFSCGCACDSDEDGDGVCDEDEVPGCMDSGAENYAAGATDSDGSCVYAPDWGVTPTPSSGILLGHVTIDEGAAEANDWIGAFTAEGICAGAAHPLLSEGLAYISLTIYGDDGLTAVEVEGMVEGEAFILRFFDASANAEYQYHEADGQWLLSGWTNTNGSPLPDYNDPTREFAFSSEPYAPQCGDVNACNYQVGGADPAACIYPEPYEDCGGNCLTDADADGVCDEVDLCVGEYDACGVCNGPGEIYACGCDGIPDGDCDCNGNELDACGVCGGEGIPEGACDCDGNVLDAIDVCGGDCAFDVDGDGICDDVDPCVGDYDACGVCNGPGAIYECGCGDIPETDCDCQGNQIDVLGVCGGGCQADADEDGICDDVDPCVGELDECGVCNGTGPAEGYDCQGNCLNDCDSDGICDQFEVMGCVYETACNYDAAATEDDGSCTYPESGYNCAGECLFDADSDGVCDQNEVTGCQDEFACNYDAMATEAGYCDYPLEYFNCNGNCLNDEDGDGVCDEFEPEGCTNEAACNFNPLAEIDNGSCLYVGCGSGCTNPSACNYDASAATDDGSCVLNESACAECVIDTTGTPPSENWEVVCISDEDGDGICDCDEVPGCEDEFACNYNEAATDDDDSCVFAESGYDCDDNCLIDSDGDGVCDQDEAVGCQDAAACNFDENATDAGYCDYADAGYDCNGFCLNDMDEDGVCDEFEIEGCTAPTACNFAPAATDDNGSCTFPVLGYDCQGNCLFDSDFDGVCDQWEVTGCMDLDACNYDINATDEGLCIYPDDAYDCQGNCLSDVDADGVCDALEILGCTDNAACNFECEATEEDGSCLFASQGYDCAGNCLVDSDADGVCDQDEVVGCLDAAACNFDANATDEGYCAFPEPEYDCNGNCINDLDGDGVCDAFEVSGCTDPAACNFIPAATEDDGSCQFSEAGYACDGSCLLDSDGDGICDQNEVTGCLEIDACNYNTAATDEGYCDYPMDGYDCNGECLNDADGDGLCDELEFLVEDAIAEELEAAVEAATEAIVSALANGDYCGDGTVWVAEWNECIGIPSCLGDLDQDGNRGTEDLLMLLSVYGTGCPEEYGCTDPAAENYNPVAVWDDGSCIVFADACMDQAAITFGDVNYELVVVNGACWFAQNLRSNQFANGDAIAEITGSFDWYQAGTNDQPAYSIVSIDPDVSDAYGHYYNGHAILDARNICPTDWHPATDEDWQALEVFLGMEPVEAANSGTRGTDQGTQLKAAAEDAPAWDGTNTVGMGVLPTGKRYNFGSSGSIGSAALLWSPSAQDATLLTREFTSDSSQIIRTTTGDAYGATVRCVKNPE